jgi:hypothetical protein
MKNVNSVLISLFAIFIAAGLLVMCGMLVWSFHLAKDFSGGYEAVNFHRNFWLGFFVGAGFYLAGCLGLGVNLKLRMAMLGGAAALAAGFAMLILLMPFVDFEGWTGATAYTLITIEFIGAVIVLALVGTRRILQKFRMRLSPR